MWMCGWRMAGGGEDGGLGTMDCGKGGGSENGKRGGEAVMRFGSGGERARKDRKVVNMAILKKKKEKKKRRSLLFSTFPRVWGRGDLEKKKKRIGANFGCGWGGLVIFWYESVQVFFLLKKKRKRRMEREEMQRGVGIHSAFLMYLFFVFFSIQPPPPHPPPSAPSAPSAPPEIFIFFYFGKLEPDNKLSISLVLILFFFSFSRFAFKERSRGGEKIGWASKKGTERENGKQKEKKEKKNPSYLALSHALDPPVLTFSPPCRTS